jgi:hypothetical protein
MNSLILISPDRGEAFNQFFLVIWMAQPTDAEALLALARESNAVNSPVV